jgi:hypothetical protein
MAFMFMNTDLVQKLNGWTGTHTYTHRYKWTYIHTYILSRIRGLRDLKDGFWIWWSNGPLYNWLQRFTNHWHTSSSAGHSLSNWTTALHSPGLFWLRYIASRRNAQRRPFPTTPGGFTAPLPSNGRASIVACSYVAGLFIEPLPRNGSMRHNTYIYIYIHTYSPVQRQYRHVRSLVPIFLCIRCTTSVYIGYLYTFTDCSVDWNTYIKLYSTYLLP